MSVLGWKEYELEVMRDTKDNAHHHLLNENFDPMACNRVTPSQSLRRRRSPTASTRPCATAIASGNPRDRRRKPAARTFNMESIPAPDAWWSFERPARSLARQRLASKATGFPHRKNSPRELAVGYTLTKSPTTSPAKPGLLRTHDSTTLSLWCHAYLEFVSFQPKPTLRLRPHVRERNLS